jgi:hypothetical protein
MNKWLILVVLVLLVLTAGMGLKATMSGQGPVQASTTAPPPGAFPGGPGSPVLVASTTAPPPGTFPGGGGPSGQQ